MPMIRKQFFIDAKTNRELQRVAAQHDVPEAELIRQGVTKVLADKSSEARDWKDKVDAFFAMSGGNEALADRVMESKAEQAKLFAKRLARNRKLLAKD